MTDFLLQEDNISFVLQEDGSSKIIITSEATGTGLELSPSTRELFLPARFGDDADFWMDELRRQLEEFARQVREDVWQGKIIFTSSGNAPTADELGEGMMMIQQSGPIYKLWVNFNGEVKSADFT